MREGQGNDLEAALCVYVGEWSQYVVCGVTSNLVKRVWEHKSEVVEGFTKQHRVHILVWHEAHETMESAIRREKAIKGWRRKWKIQLIEKSNPYWLDLYEDVW